MTSQLRNSQDFSCWLGLASSACSTNPVLLIASNIAKLPNYLAANPKEADH